MSIVKQKKQLTPKVNHTKTMIAKSTPFLIRRHHLDDSQMKKVLRYQQTVRQISGRTYSYQGQRMTYQSSKKGSRMRPVDQLQTPLSTKIKEINQNEYYNLPQTNNPVAPQLVSQNSTNQEMPYFRNTRQMSANNKKQSQKYQYNSYNPNNNETVNKNKQIQKLARQMREKQEYGLRQMKNAREKMEKQAKKLRKMYQKKVQRDVKKIQNNQVYQLEEHIRQLKIQNLEAEKQKLQRQLNQNISTQNKRKQRVDSSQNMGYTRAQLILGKPRYKPKPTMGQDTDSSFSSFEFN